ncbi:UDP-2,3-diacylglucosamine diphosphatase [Maribacter sp. 2307UL18-2]|uniref:UDP-2,3-diacylglucosamine diphosphatase n=1 Tax=Maribacter sp. 2307UL18-2 TaxID=3386274 RepID=UPI0039BCB8AA
MKKRKLEISVISDVHLGTYACHAEELLAYLNSIQPRKLILNGDIIDIWQVERNYFPPAHIKVLRKILGMAAKGTEVYYITGDHDEALRKFSDTTIGNLHIVNKLVLDLGKKKVWFFHGDVFDTAIQKLKWLTKLGGRGYDLLLLVNKILNGLFQKMGKERYPLSQKIKLGAKDAVKHIADFENTAVQLAIENGYDYVVCGHMHQPKKEVRHTQHGECTYLNSGDWVEHLTALEYNFKRWKVYNYDEDKLLPFFVDDDIRTMDMQELVAIITQKKEGMGKAKQRPEKEGEIPLE